MESMVAQQRLSVGAAIDKLLELPDLDFARWAAGNRLRGMSRADFETLCGIAGRDAAQHWDWLTRENLPCSPADRIRGHGVRVEDEVEGLFDKAFVHFAVFDPGRKVVEISREAVAQVDRLIQQHALCDHLGQVQTETVVLWHEYYHVMTHAHKAVDGSFWSRVFAPRHGQVSAECSRLHEEMAAICFSKIASGLAYHPQVLQWMLVYTRDPANATRILNDILKKSVMR